MREFAHPGSKFFHYRLNPFFEGTGVQEVSKIAFVVNNGGKTSSSIHIHFLRIVTILKTISQMKYQAWDTFTYWSVMDFSICIENVTFQYLM